MATPNASERQALCHLLVGIMALGLVACGDPEPDSLADERSWRVTRLGESDPCIECATSRCATVVTDPRPEVAVNAGGRALAVWSKCSDATEETVTVVSYFDGARWDEIPGSRRDLSRPVGLAVGAAGDAWFIWSREYAIFHPTQGWSPTQPFDLGDHAGFSGRVRLRLDARNGPLAAWSRFYGGRPTMFYASRLEPDSTWTQPRGLLHPTTVNNERLAVGLDGQGNALFVWEEEYPETIATARFDGEMGWSPSQTIGEERSESPGLATSSSGQAVASWFRHEGHAAHLVAARYEPSVGWMAPVVLARYVDPWDGPAVSVDERGNALVVWGACEYSGECRLQATQLRPDGSFETTPSPPVESRTDAEVGATIDAMLKPTDLGRRVAFQSTQSAVAVWAPTSFPTSRWEAEPVEVQVIRFHDGYGWDEPQIILSGGRPVVFDIGVDGRGRAFVALIQEQPGATFGVFVAQSGPGS